MDALSRRPTAVVFDVDGLLVDTEPCWSVAEAGVFARHGLPFGPEQKALLIGRSLPDACATLAELFVEPDPAVIEAELLGRVAEVIDAEAEAMPGAQEIVDAVAARVPVAVASNSPRALMEAALRRGGFSFAVSRCADDVAAPKPAPDLYLAACAALSAPPPGCLAFEDSRTGVRSARAAGVPCVGVPSLPGVALDADVVVTSLADPDLRERIERW